MSSKQFRPISIEKRPRNLHLNQREATCASETTLIPDGDYLCPIEWNGRTGMQPVSV
jgi:hypothetical protein